MSLSIKAKDWKVSPVAQVGGADVVGGGVYWFNFESAEANCKEMFMFVGGGIGMGGSAGGAGLTPASPIAIECERPFSVTNLNLSVGRLSMAGASLAAGYGLMWISAFNWDGAMFSSQYVGGLNTGVALNAQILAGGWRSMTLAARDANDSLRAYLHRSS